MDRRLTRAEALGLRVADVMVERPKTLPASVTVGELRLMFENPRHVTALLVDERGTFVGSVERDRLSPSGDDSQPAADYASTDKTIGPDAQVTEALELMDRESAYRLVVVDEESGLLRGLICLSSNGESLCAG
jgi:CBS domain-containing protein